MSNTTQQKEFSVDELKLQVASLETLSRVLEGQRNQAQTELAMAQAKIMHLEAVIKSAQDQAAAESQQSALTEAK